jgi:outer membrane protein
VTRQVFGLLAISLGVSALGFAQQQKVGVINIQGAIVSTKDGQKAASELEQKSAPKRKSLEAKQNEINSLKDQLQKGQNTLSEAAKNDLYRTIDQKTKSLNRDMEDAQAELDQDQQKVLQDLGQKMMAVITKYANENGYTLILDVSNPQTPVLYASTGIDITKQIIDIYDRNNPGGAGAPTSTTSAAPPATGGNAVPATSRTPASVAPGTTARPAPTRKP